MILDGWNRPDDRFSVTNDGRGPQFIADIQAVNDPAMFRSDAEDHYVAAWAITRPLFGLS